MIIMQNMSDPNNFGGDVKVILEGNSWQRIYLIYLARMEESRDALQMIEFPVSEVVWDTAMSFRTLAQAQGKEFACNVQPMLSMCGDNKAIGQLVSILTDNALKYSSSGGIVSLHFVRQNKILLLTVFNTTETFITPESLHHVFDRFYRMEKIIPFLSPVKYSGL